MSMSRGKQRPLRCAGFLVFAIAARGVTAASVLLAGLEAGPSISRISRGSSFGSCRRPVNSAELRDPQSRASVVRSAILPCVELSSCQDRRTSIFMNPSSAARSAAARQFRPGGSARRGLALAREEA
jgi:hypothetical protein